MVKSKKMSKSSIAVIVLSILLVLSMIMGMTGAWFTDNANGGNQGNNNQFTFGRITAPLTISDTAMTVTLAGEKAVPGDTVTLPAVSVSYTADFKTYLFLTLNDVVVKQGETTLTAEQVQTLFKEITAENGIGLGLESGMTALAGNTGVYYKQYDAETPVSFTSEERVLTIDEDLTRATKLQGASGPVLEGSTITITFSVSAKVIQADHFNDAAAAYAAL